MAIAAQVIDVAPAPIVIILADIRRLVYFNFAIFIVSALASNWNMHARLHRLSGGKNCR